MQKKGDKILDTNFGSASSAIACWDLGYDLTAYEIDKVFFTDGKNRFEIHKQQLQLNDPVNNLETIHQQLNINYGNTEKN
jgi:DNA modification methylase